MRSRTMRKEAMDIVGSGVGVGGGDSGGGGGGGGGGDCGGGGGGDCDDDDEDGGGEGILRDRQPAPETANYWPSPLFTSFSLWSSRWQ